MTKERPILFSGEMVRAILAGRKTQTRRVVKPAQTKPKIASLRVQAWIIDGEWFSCPYGQAGDRLWVRETWRKLACPRHDEGQPPGALCLCNQVQCRADGDDGGKWRPSIFMPRWASRITLEITGVRLERVQDLSEADAIAEGMPADDDWPNWVPCPQCQGRGVYAGVGNYSGYYEYDCDKCNTHRKQFRHAWDSINAERGYRWDVNPWVWVISFKRLEQ